MKFQSIFLNLYLVKPCHHGLKNGSEIDLEKREKKKDVSNTVRVSRVKTMSIDVCMCSRKEKEKSVSKQQDNIYFKTMNGVCVRERERKREREREREITNNLRSLREPFHLKIFPLAFLH